MGTELQQILNYRQFDEHVACSGQPTAEQFQIIADTGYWVVINLAMPNSDNAIPDEGFHVTTTGMRYVHLPVAWEAPMAADVELFISLMNSMAKQKVWVHCALNWRASCFLYLWELSRGRAESDARRVMDTLWNPQEYPVWQQLLKQLKTK